MQLQITRLPSDNRTYLVLTSSGKQYDVHDSELRRWLLNLGVDEVTIDGVLKIGPNHTTTLQTEKAA